MPHADIHDQKGMQSYELASAHKKRSEISGETRFVGLVARPVRRAFHGCQGHSGLGRACNMKVCVGAKLIFSLFTPPRNFFFLPFRTRFWEGKESREGREKEMEDTGDGSVEPWIHEDPREWSSEKVATFVRSLGAAQCHSRTGLKISS
jgi:hypothetical protein